MPSTREPLDSYLAERSLRLSPGSLKSERFYLERFSQFLKSLGVDEVGSVSPRHLELYRHHLETTPGTRGKKASLSYVRTNLSACRLFLVWCLGAGCTLVDFESYPLPKCRPSDIRVLTVDQLRKLLEAPTNLRDSLILESFYTLGLRRVESYRLDWPTFVSPEEPSGSPARVAANGFFPSANGCAGSSTPTSRRCGHVFRPGPQKRRSGCPS